VELDLFCIHSFTSSIYNSRERKRIVKSRRRKIEVEEDQFEVLRHLSLTCENFSRVYGQVEGAEI